MSHPDRQNPLVSVIIAVGRDRPLYEESLKRQDYPAVEVIAIAGHTAAEARNIGIKRAAGEYIVFIDDDVVLPERFLSTGAGLMRASGADIVGGPNIIMPGASWREKIGDVLIASGIFNGFRRKFKKAKNAAFCDYRHFAACNVIMKPSVFEKVGAFDERYRYTEDMELFFRCESKGLSMFHSPDFYVYHKRRFFPFAYFRQVFFWGYGNMQMAVRHPKVFLRADMWGSFILLPVCLWAISVNWKLALAAGVALFPLAVHFLGYALGALTGFAVFFGRNK